MEVPMLDEAEFSTISRLYSEGFRPGGEDLKERFQPVCDAYFRMTGYRETVANAVMHHRISLYGPNCPSCGKPFRSPKASFCAECGFKPNKLVQPTSLRSAADE